ncbi:MULTISPECIES: hypothetical protein [Pontibacter]|nr:MULTISPECIES: hypothetical protein [Pontibacter]
MIQPKYRILRHLLMSLALLWAIVLSSTATYAADTAKVAQSSLAGLAPDESVSTDNDLTGLQKGLLYLAQEGTTATLTFSFQPAATVSKTHTIWFVSQKAIPPYAARAPGDNFFCQFFYTSSQPQAP